MYADGRAVRDGAGEYPEAAVGHDRAQVLDLEAEAQAVCMLNPNFKEAYHAFVEKREADFV